MEFYVIPPLANLELMHEGDRYFCLAQLYAQSEEYQKFFLNLPDTAWVTLDNGAGDHDLVNEDTLFEVMKELKPNEVIPPDVIGNHKRTITNAQSFYERMVEEGMDDIEVFFCPQGDTQQHWLECYKWALEEDWIDTIGMSKIAIPWAFLQADKDEAIMEARHNCFNILKVNHLLKKPLHFLGMGDPREFKYYMDCVEGRAWVRSSDSCNTVWSAMNGLDWQYGQFERIPTPKDYFQRELPHHPIPEVMAADNIEYLRDSVAEDIPK